MRVFVAINPPGWLQERVGQLTSALRRSAGQARWVEPQHLHITMKFLGEMNAQALPSVIETLQSVAGRYSAFSLCLNGFGFFPPHGEPRILYIGTNQQALLQTLAMELEECFSVLGFAREKRFTPHMTLARFKSSGNLSKLKRQLDCLKVEEEFPVDYFTLFHSTLTADGPVYKPIHQAEFRQPMPGDAF